MSIQYELRDHIVTITIDRYERRNAIDADQAAKLIECWERFRDDTEAWVAIITGVRNVFCSGGDTKSSASKVFRILKHELGASDNSRAIAFTPNACSVSASRRSIAIADATVLGLPACVVSAAMMAGLCRASSRTHDNSTASAGPNICCSDLV